MFTKLKFSIVLLVLAFSLAITSPLRAVIYGSFDVYDYYEQPYFASVADRTFVMVNLEFIVCGQETCVFQAESLSDYVNLSPDDPMSKFGHQPTPGRCSAFLAGSSTGATNSGDLIVTAGYCVDSYISDYVFVLGWHVDSADDDGWGPIPLSNVYTAVEVLADIETSEKDFAVVRLDRPVPMTPLSPSGSIGIITVDVPVACVGHSVGTPAKIHTNAEVTDSREGELDYFVTNLDVYGGVGGSPVVHHDTLEVFGLLVRGETDFVVCGSYNCSNQLSDTSRDGEEVNRIDPVLEYLVPYRTVGDLLSEVVEQVATLNLQQGISNSLDAKLDNVAKALGDVNQNNDESAVHRLEAFINEVLAQAGKKIPIEAADELILSAQTIIDLIRSG